MSQRVERAAEAFRRMWAEMDMRVAEAVLHEDLVLDWSESLGPYRGVYRGIEEARRFFATFAESFGAVDWHVRHVFELGDRAAVGSTLVVHGEGSGVAASGAGGQVWEFEGDRVRAVKLRQSWEEAVRELRTRRLAEARLYFVCDAIAGVDEILEAALEGGADIIQLREKSPRCEEELVSFSDPFRRAAAKHGALLFINDRPDLVKTVDADGVHVGQDDEPVASARAQAGEAALVGLSTHAPAQFDAAMAARGHGRPDYVSVGPVWETPTKAGRPAAGVEYVRYAADHAELPWFAIGGIDAANINEVTAAGASRAVVVRAIRDAADPREAASALAAALPTASRYEFGTPAVPNS